MIVSLLYNWMKLRYRKKPGVGRACKHSMELALEFLEDRITPVVGKTYIPAPVMPGDPYNGTAGFFDGVVHFTNNIQSAQGRIAQAVSASGALIAGGSQVGELDSHYILTAAHLNDPGFGGSIIFNLQRSEVSVNLDIPIPDGTKLVVLL